MTTDEAKRFVEEHPNDPRSEPFHRKDGYRRVSRVYPNPADSETWICPECGKPTETFYGEGPPFKDGRYVESDNRMCLGCWYAEHRGGVRKTPKGGCPRVEISPWRKTPKGGVPGFGIL